MAVSAADMQNQLAEREHLRDTLYAEFRVLTDGIDFSSLGYKPPEVIQQMMMDNRIRSIAMHLISLLDEISNLQNTINNQQNQNR